MFDFSVEKIVFFSFPFEESAFGFDSKVSQGFQRPVGSSAPCAVGLTLGDRNQSHHHLVEGSNPSLLR
ncbi:hypothetical protein DLM77_11680 [Leptospira yasudae]|uniref:Uncharacterized protein n=1 Tax=Leptospira yasudae TaxID=2202201 RepID=A0ABX9M246_9LEPT|nr:hypothetical protein DLM77_11680 [Leptospira yasudae]